MLAVTNSDETNLVACMVANILSPSTKKVARVRSADYDHYSELFCNNPPYIETVINPEMELVKTIERLMSVPDATDVGEFAADASSSSASGSTPAPLLRAPASWSFPNGSKATAP